MNQLEKTYRFFWRAFINVVCIIPGGRAWLFPQTKLASSFGRGDGEYAWRVFISHYRQLHEQNFATAQRVLELGPGMNLGNSLLWWCYLSSKQGDPAVIICWDVFKNASPEKPNFWPALARELLGQLPAVADRLPDDAAQPLLQQLESVAEGAKLPAIEYCVMPMESLVEQLGTFDLIYSQAVIEHIWFIERFWVLMEQLTAPGGWHSHRIDLADHGRRESNYIEMLQWSVWTYWLTQRFIPGAINRWRVGDHLRMIERLGLRIFHNHMELRDALPVARSRLARPFRNLDERELRCTAVDLVACKNQSMSKA